MEPACYISWIVDKVTSLWYFVEIGLVHRHGNETWNSEHWLSHVSIICEILFLDMNKERELKFMKQNTEKYSDHRWSEWKEFFAEKLRNAELRNFFADVNPVSGQWHRKGAGCIADFFKVIVVWIAL